MIKTYLENMMETILDEKLELEEKAEEIAIKQSEIERFIEILEEKNDPNFESFTPREVNGKNKEKIIELKNEKESLHIDALKIAQQLEDNKKSRDELSSMIKNLEEKESKDKKNEKFEKEDKIVSREKYRDLEKDINDMEDILNKINYSMKFFEVDVVRTKIELGSLLPKLEYKLEEIKSKM